QKATFNDDVTLFAAKIDGQLSMSGSTFEKRLNGNNLHVGHDLLMDQKATFNDDVTLTAAKIGGQLSVDSSTFAKGDGESLQVGQDLLMLSAVCKAPVSLLFARVGGSLDLNRATLAGLDLTGARMVQDLCLA